MPIVNRDLDSSSQRVVINSSHGFAAGVVGTGVTLTCALVPWPSTLDAVRVGAFGLSGAPAVALSVNRLIVGTGFTTMTLGMTSLTVPAFGTSGMGSGVLAASGNSLLVLQAGDLLCLTTSGAATAAIGYVASFVLKATQDIKSSFGI